MDALDDGLQGAYILRKVGIADFTYENGQNKLLGLAELDFHTTQTVALTTVTEDEMDEVKERQSKLMSLATKVDLDSRASVRPAVPLVYACHC